MASNLEELDVRLGRLEHDLLELSATVASRSMRQDRRGDSAMSRISLAAWLQISGPTFITMVFGFTLLWNAQQAQSGALLEVQRSVGRLEGSISGLDSRIQGLDSRIQSLDARIQSLDARIEGLDVRLDKLGDAVNALAKRVGSS
jgi:peptidoglycan hydrolase CwlO-like protein